MAAKKQETIQVLAPDIGKLRITIKGTGDGLIVHRFGEKAKEQLRLQGMPASAKPKKGPRKPDESFRDAMYVIEKNAPDNRYGETGINPKFDKRKHLHGFPANAIKGAMVTAATDLDIFKTTIRRNIFVHGTHGDLLEIKAESEPVMREDIVRLSGVSRAPDLRYRPHYEGWSIVFAVTFNRAVVTKEAVVNLLAHAGIFVGLAERRPEKEGNTYGTFEVTKVEEID